MGGLALAAAALWGCEVKEAVPVFEEKSAALQHVDTCEDLLAGIRADALERLEFNAAALRESYLGLDGMHLTGRFDLMGSWADSGDDGGLERDFPNSGLVPQSGDAPGVYSRTNTQTDGVDEADIVKTDGERIYLLHGQEFFLFDSWPAAETEKLGSIELPGQPIELFVEGGRAIVFSTPDPAELPPEVVRDLQGGPSPNGGIYPECYDCAYEDFTQISIFDVTGDQPVVQDEFLLQGNYASSRRYGRDVRVITRTNWLSGYGLTNSANASLAYDTYGHSRSRAQIAVAINQWVADARQAIADTDELDWLPGRFVRRDGEWQREPIDCTNFYLPDTDLSYVGAVQVATFDIETPAPSVVTIVGGADIVYSSDDTLVVGQADHRWDLGRTDETRTALHTFALEPDTTNYLASGFVPGYPHNQFSLDEKDDVIRVSTTHDRVVEGDDWTVETENRVYTLTRDGTDLRVIGQTEPFGELGETIYATRFLGDRGYVVTYRQTDPLVTVDLSNPREPKVLGSLHIPGFSEY
ncbi:MAG TPA: beta-propeller domain-containing protein, partial [Polyangiaceae bacterium]|nr:beta-propeller domain-containing protein [Polyangiaceae bacterium]